MAYGKLKANEIVYDTGAGDVTVQISSIPDTSSGIATTGEVSGGSLNTTGSISGNTLAITSGASAATFTGTAGNFVTATCDTGVFTYLSGTTTTGTTVNFTTGTVGTFYASTINKPAGAGTSLLITGDRVNAATGIFGTGTVTGLAATTIAAIEATDLTITATTGIYTLLSGATVTGGVFNGVSGNFGTLGVTGTASLTTISGNTVTGNNLHVTTTAQFASGVNVAATGSLGVYDGAGGYMRFKTPVALGEGNSQEFTTPSGDGTSGQLLATDGAGVLYWKTDSAAPGSGEALTGVNLQSFSFVSGIHDTQNNIYSHVYATSGTFVSGLSSNSFTTSTGTITGLATNSINATEGGALTLTAATGTFTTGTITGLTSTNADIATGTLSTGTITGLAATTGNITSLFSSTGTITGLTSTTATATTFTYTTGNVEEAGVQNFRYPGAESSTGLVSLSAGTSTGGTVSPSVTYYLPRTDGTSGYVLSTDAAGQLSWVDNGAVAANATLTGLNVVTNQTANSLAATTGTFTSLTGTTTTGVSATFTTGIFTTTVSGFNITGTYAYVSQTIRAGIAGSTSSTLSSTGVTIKNGKDFTIAVANVGANFTLTFPGSSPTSGYVLKASTGGVLEWAADSAIGDNATLTGLNVVTNQTANSLAATTGTFTSLTGTTTVGTTAAFTTVSGTTVTGTNVYALTNISGRNVYGTIALSGGNVYATNTISGGTVSTAAAALTPEQLLVKQNSTQGFQYPADENSTGIIQLSAGTATGGTVAPSVTYYLPRADGTSGYVLSTDAAGQLSWVDKGALGDNATLTGLNVVTNQTANSLAATTGSFTTVTASTGVFTSTLSGSTITGGSIIGTSVRAAGGPQLEGTGLKFTNGKSITINTASISSNFTLQLPGTLPTFGTAISSGNYALIATTNGVGQWVPQGRVAVKAGAISQGSYALDVSGGPIQYITLSANTTLTNTNFANGDSVFLRINNPGSQGSLFSLTYPQGTVYVGADGNTAPTLTSGDYFLFWKVNNTFYASKVGGFA
jgi:trimeric autotransporter adhesin